LEVSWKTLDLSLIQKLAEVRNWFAKWHQNHELSQKALLESV